MVEDALVRGEPALTELAEHLKGAVDSLKAGEDLSPEQLATLVELEKTLEDVRACLK